MEESENQNPLGHKPRGLIFTFYFLLLIIVNTQKPPALRAGGFYLSHSLLYPPLIPSSTLTSCVSIVINCCLFTGSLVITGLVVRVLRFLITSVMVGVMGVVLRYLSLIASASVVLPSSNSFWYLELLLLPLDGEAHLVIAVTVRLSVKVSVLGLSVLSSLHLRKVQRLLGMTSTGVVVLP